MRERTHWLLAYHLLFLDNVGENRYDDPSIVRQTLESEQLVLGPNGLAFGRGVEKITAP
jgi:hypothetical protein